MGEGFPPVPGALQLAVPEFLFSFAVGDRHLRVQQQLYNCEMDDTFRVDGA